MRQEEGRRIEELCGPHQGLHEPKKPLRAAAKMLIVSRSARTAMEKH
jgi:hypothetical protein